MNYDRQLSLLFVVQATMEIDHGDGWTSTRQVPTFYLDGNIQGFSTHASAITIAEDILNMTGDPRITIHATAYRV